MKTFEMKLSRRRFFASLLATAAWPHVVLSQATSEPSADLSGCVPLNDVNIQITGTPMGQNALLLTIEETALQEPPPFQVSLGAPISVTLDPMDRKGGRGSLGGVDGDFSAAKHATALQLFQTVPEVIGGSSARIFAQPLVSVEIGLAADKPATWQVTSDNAPVSVTQVYRKSVPISTITLKAGDHASRRRHLVTLILDQEISPDAVIEVTADGLPDLRIDMAAQSASELIHICTAGYPTDGPKSAYIGSWLGTDAEGKSMSSDAFIEAGTPWTLVRSATGEMAAKGELKLAKAVDEPHAKEENYNGCNILEADFSEVNSVGDYTLQVEGLGISAKITVAETPYEEVFRAAARWYFHNRSGCEIDKLHGEGRIRPRNGHPQDGLVVWQSTVQLGRTSEGFASEPQGNDAVAQTSIGDGSGTALNDNAWGGWHDAGDWDRRIQHMDPVYTMAHMVETLQSARNLAMNIPESGLAFAHPDVAARKSAEDRGDGVTVLPDLIHEALWGISLWRRTQTEDGAIIGGVEYSLDGISGSVSWNPVQNTYAYAAEEWAAYYFARAAAKLGQVIATVCGDTVLGGSLIAEAERAWDWAETVDNAEELAGDDAARERISWARSNASGSLYRATGREDFRKIFEDSNSFAPKVETEIKPAPRATVIGSALDYVRSADEGREVDAGIVEAILKWASSRDVGTKPMGSDYGLQTSDTYRFGAGWLRFGPGSNWPASMFALVLGTGEADVPDLYAKTVRGMWFALGCNPSNVSFVQGFGGRQFGDPLHKDLSRQCKVPGQLSFGVAGGNLRYFETDKIGGDIYPQDEDKWPVYARIFESSAVPICAEFGIRSNAMEWLYACAVLSELHSLLPDR